MGTDLRDGAPMPDDGGALAAPSGVLATSGVAPPPAGPWRRFFARQADYFLFVPAVTLPLEAAWSALLAAGETSAFGDPAGGLPGVLLGAAALNVACVVAFVLPEALMLRAWGTTPGKWLFRVRVVPLHGVRPTFAETLDRSLRVAVLGMALGLPFLWLLSALRAWRVLVERGRLEWEGHGFRVARAGWRGPGGLAVPVLLAAGGAGFAAFFVRVGEAPPGRDPFAADAEARLAVLGQGIAEASRAKRGTVTATSPVVHGALASGEEEVLELEVGPAPAVLVLATCDRDCTDLDLEATEGGRLLGLDRDEDPTPLVVVPAPERRAIEVRVRMVACEVEPCAYALQVLSSTESGFWFSGGTCFAVAPDGRILTAHHVVAVGGTPVVQFEGSPPLEARLVRISPANDLALLRVDAPTPAWLPLLGEEPRLGERVLTVGHPVDEILGAGPRFGQGVIGGLTGLLGEHNSIQVSVPALPGSSGSPVMDYRGRVVGLLVAGADPEAFEERLGMQPESLRWAIRAAYARVLVGEVPDLPPAASREEAIERARRAVCQVAIRPVSPGTSSGGAH